MKRRGAMVAVLVVILVLSLGVQAGALVSPVKVLGGPEDQYFPFSNGSWLVWSENSAKHGGHFDAFAKRSAKDFRFQLNAKGNEGVPGNFVPGTDKVVFQQYDPGDGVSDLFLYDLSSRKRTAMRDVNTDRWEWHPRVSTKFLLFTRSDFAADRDRLLLVRRDSGFTRTVMNINNSKKRIYPESVGERYATFSVCGAKCLGYVYDSADGTTDTIPTDGRWVYASAIDEARGALYFVRSGDSCGANVGIFKMSIGGHNPTKIVDLPNGIDVLNTSIAPASGGHLDLYFDRVPCKEDSDIYKARKVDGIPV